MARVKPERDRIYFSGKVRGERRNFNHAVRFDFQDGFVGIIQYEGESVADRVLLSPAQFKVLEKFYNDPVRNDK